jgi:hypothetical protein
MSNCKSDARESVARHRAAKAVEERLDVFARAGEHFADIKTQAHDIALAAILTYQHSLAESGRVSPPAIPPAPEMPCSPSGPEVSAPSHATLDAHLETIAETNRERAESDAKIEASVFPRHLRDVSRLVDDLEQSVRVNKQHFGETYERAQRRHGR